MPTKKRIIIVSLLILLGGVLFCYCAVFYPIEMTAPAKGIPTPAVGGETTHVKKTSTGGIEREKTDQTNPTRSESKPRPRTGAT